MIADETKVEKVKYSVNHIHENTFNKSIHTFMLLIKDMWGLDNNDIALLVKLQEMIILNYAFQEMMVRLLLFIVELVIK